MFIQLLNLLERYYVYLHLCLLSLSSHKIVSIADVVSIRYVCPLLELFKKTMSNYITYFKKFH